MLERLVSAYGEENRRLIEDALEFLEKKPWFDATFDVEAYVANLIAQKFTGS
jgi:hypothetical protein